MGTVETSMHDSGDGARYIPTEKKSMSLIAKDADYAMRTLRRMGAADVIPILGLDKTNVRAKA